METDQVRAFPRGRTRNVRLMFPLSHLWIRAPVYRPWSPACASVLLTVQNQPSFQDWSLQQLGVRTAQRIADTRKRFDRRRPCLVGPPRQEGFRRELAVSPMGHLWPIAVRINVE